MQAFYHRQHYPKVPLGGIRGRPFDRIAILISAVKRVDRVPTLSINSLHPYHFDRIGILSARDSIIIRIPAPANMFIQHYPKVPLGGLGGRLSTESQFSYQQ